MFAAAAAELLQTALPAGVKRLELLDVLTQSLLIKSKFWLTRQAGAATVSGEESSGAVSCHPLSIRRTMTAMTDNAGPGLTASRAAARCTPLGKLPPELGTHLQFRVWVVRGFILLGFVSIHATACLKGESSLPQTALVQ